MTAEATSKSGNLPSAPQEIIATKLGSEVTRLAKHPEFSKERGCLALLEFDRMAELFKRHLLIETQLNDKSGELEFTTILEGLMRSNNQQYNEVLIKIFVDLYRQVQQWDSQGRLILMGTSHCHSMDWPVIQVYLPSSGHVVYANYCGYYWAITVENPLRIQAPQKCPIAHDSHFKCFASTDGKTIDPHFFPEPQPTGYSLSISASAGRYADKVDSLKEFIEEHVLKSQIGLALAVEPHAEGPSCRQISTDVRKVLPRWAKCQ